MPILVVAAAIYIVWWLYEACHQASLGISEGEAIVAANFQNFWFRIYVNLTREDWESLGISREILTELVGEQNYKTLIRKWYGTEK